MTATPPITTLGELLDAGGPDDSHGVQIRLPSGKWSKTYVYVGSMWRAKSHTYTYVTMADLYETGRRYVDEHTEVRLVPR